MKRLKLLGWILTLLFASKGMATVYPFVEGNQLELLENSRQSAELKLKLIREAKHHIHIITFFWDDTDFPQEMTRELVEANKRGVEVRVLTTYFPSLATDLTGQGRREISDQAEGRKTPFSFLALKSYDNLVLFNNLHEKIFLVDGSKAILGGRNISDSRFNGKDLEVLIEGPVVNQIQRHFHKMNEFVVDLMIDKKCKRRESRRCQRTLEEFTGVKFSTTPTYFPEQPHFNPGVPARILAHEAIIQQLENDYRGARNRIQMPDDIIEALSTIEFDHLRGYNYFIMPTPAYRSFLESRLASGKRIELVTNSLRSAAEVSAQGYYFSLPDMLDLSRQGLEIIEWQAPEGEGYLHSKVMIFDDERVLIGSHNFGIGSTSVSNEIALDFKSEEIAQRLIEVFEQDKLNPERARAVSTSFLEESYREHRLRSRILRSAPIQWILRELY